VVQKLAEETGLSVLCINSLGCRAADQSLSRQNSAMWDRALQWGSVFCAESPLTGFRAKRFKIEFVIEAGEAPKLEHSQSHFPCPFATA